MSPFWTSMIWFSLAGWILTALWNFKSFDVSTQVIPKFKETFEAYWRKSYYFVISSFIGMIVFTNVINQDGLGFLFTLFFKFGWISEATSTFINSVATIPIVKKVFCFVMGLNIELILGQLRRSLRKSAIQSTEKSAISN